MAFISLKFFLFFALVLAVYYLLPAREQKLFLLLASWVFYYLQSGALLVLLLLATLISYLAALAMERRALARRLSDLGISPAGNADGELWQQRIDYLFQ